MHASATTDTIGDQALQMFDTNDRPFVLGLEEAMILPSLGRNNLISVPHLIRSGHVVKMHAGPEGMWMEIDGNTPDMPKS